MFKKSFITKALHKIFSWLPEASLCIFGNCKNACASLAMEEDVDNIKSTKLKLHLSICKKCWSYYHQMNLVNKKISASLKSAVSEQYKVDRKSASVEDLVAKFSKNN